MISFFKNKKLLVFIDQGLVSGSNFLLAIYLARMLSIDAFGIYALLWMIALFFLSVQQAALTTPMYSLEPKYLGESPERVSSLVIIQCQFSFISAAFVACLLFVLSVLQAKWSVGLLVIPFSFTVLLLLLQDFMRRVFCLKERYFVVIIMDVVAYLGLLGLLYFFSNHDQINLSDVFTFYSISFMLSVLFAFFKIGRVKYKKGEIGVIFREYWHFSKWLSLANILQWLASNLFVAVAGYILGVWVVGVIRVFQSAMGVFHVVFQALENFVPISASKIYQKSGLQALLKYIYKCGIWGIIFTILSSAIVIIVTPESLISYIYGSQYAVYGYLLYWYLFIYLLIYLGTLSRYILRTLEITKTIYKAYMYSVILSLLCVWPLVEYFKIKGVVIGVVLTQVVMLWVYLHSINNRIRETIC
mgnify:CR=1 FL=1